MKTNRPDLVAAAIILGVILLLTGFTWVNYNFALQSPGGNDFIPRWIGTRMFITDHISPYSDNTTEAIQDFFYGRPAQGNEDYQLFVYPHYSMLVFAPFSVIENFDVARGFWMTTLEVSVIVIAIVSLFVIEWKPPALVFAIFMIFSISWYHAVRPLINGNAAILVALFIALTLLLIRIGWDRAAGILLALSTIKPQMVVLFIPLVLIWAYSIRRRRLIISFVFSMAVLVGFSTIMETDWMIKNLQQVLFYPKYTEPGTPALIFSEWWPDIGRGLGLILSGVLAIVLVLEWIAVLGKDFRWFFWTACITLVITNLVGIRTTTANYIALFPALTLVFSVWDQRWGRGGRWLVIVAIAVFFIGLWSLFLSTVEIGAGNQPVQSAILFFPLPLFLLFGLYWIRYWAVKPRNLDSNQVKMII